VSSPPRSRIIKRCVYIAAATIAHAALAVFLFFGYMQHAMNASGGGMDPSASTHLLQYLRVALLFPIYLPLLEHRADLLAAPLGPVFLLLNSFIWVMAAWGLLCLLKLRRGVPGPEKSSAS